MHSFSAQLKIIGVNPYVEVPENILRSIFTAANKNKGPIPIHGLINDKPYTQTLVRYVGEWRLYVNTTMLKNSPKHVEEILNITIAFDQSDRTLPLHAKLQIALNENPHAAKVFESLSPSHRHEINRYITRIKSSAKVDENIQRAIDHLNGNGRFVGRDL